MLCSTTILLQWFQNYTWTPSQRTVGIIHSSVVHEVCKEMGRPKASGLTGNLITKLVMKPETTLSISDSNTVSYCCSGS